MSVLRVSQLFLKPEREAAMTEQTYLDLDPDNGIIGSAPSILPRQVNITTSNSLENHGVSAAGSRANIILDGSTASVRSGTRLTIGPAQIRITFPCEPCGRGARLAGTPLGRLRQIDRYLAVIITQGRIHRDQRVALEEGAYPQAPGDFKTRVAWAVSQIPAGRVVRSGDFLTAIGASRAYHRALPGWLRQATARDLPGHRVLTADLAPPSWCPEAVQKLADEGLPPGDYSTATWPLASALWGKEQLGP